jgi:quercetin dioxygenase-like cupin family protein
MITDAHAGRRAATIGTEDDPLVHPVTGERIVFRKRAVDTGGELLELNLYMAPGGFLAAPHIHPNQEERFEISGAEVMFRIGGKEQLHQPGDIVTVPAGTPHTWWNPSDREVATLIQFRPGLDTETFFETFFGLAADGKVNAKGMPGPLQLAVLARAYRREMSLPPPQGWILGPLSIALAPIGQLLGYRARYEKYSGPLPPDQRS